MPNHIVALMVIAGLLLAIICTVTPGVMIVADEISGGAYGIGFAANGGGNVDDLSAQRVAKSH